MAAGSRNDYVTLVLLQKQARTAVGVYGKSKKIEKFGTLHEFACHPCAIRNSILVLCWNNVGTLVVQSGFRDCKCWNMLEHQLTNHKRALFQHFIAWKPRGLINLHFFSKMASSSRNVAKVI